MNISRTFTRGVILLLVFALTSCGGSSDQSVIQTIVAGTLESLAMTESAPAAATELPTGERL